MGKHTYGFVRLGLQGVRIGCKNRFVGKGDRCKTAPSGCASGAGASPDTRFLLRARLDCPTLVRGKARCHDCQCRRDQAKNRAKATRRPDLHADAHERERRRRVVADLRAMVGDWCSG